LRYFVKSFGCRLNQYYADYFSNAVVLSGEDIVKREEDADIVAVASCVVTHKAERDLRHYLSHIKSLNPKAKIVVFGCYPKFKQLEGVLASGDIHDVLKTLELDDPKTLKFPLYRVRTNIRVQEGCNFRCSYCIVPFVRGPSRSRPLSEIMDEISNVYRNKVVEVVLTGIQTGEWGREWGMSIVDLVREINRQFPDLRIRLSSISPIHIKDDLIELLSQGIVLPHLHLPIQHGSPKVLREMKRPYKLDFYLKLLEKIISKVENVAIGTDIIVGFPTETDEDFEESYNLIKDLPFAYMHVFEFSPRPGTPAGEMRLLPSSLVKLRKVRLLQLAKDKKISYLRNQVGKTIKGVVEAYEEGRFSGTLDNYVKVNVPGDYALEIGKVYSFRVLKAEESYVVGIPQDS